eukprot:COSAG01_NODE_33260_length_567_cov_0.991453_1_plen_58_part_10
MKASPTTKDKAGIWFDLKPITVQLGLPFVCIRGSILTPKQKQFCQEYMVDLNGSKAAI